MTGHLPEGYQPLSRRGVRGFAWTGAVDWLEEVLERDGTVEAWARGEDSVTLEGGRGGTRARAAPVSGPQGRARWACRHYRRGGCMASMLRDRYVSRGRERPFLELEASARARGRGIHTPAVVAGVVYASGPFYRADLVTELVPDAPSLGEWLRRDPHDVARAALLRRAGNVVRSLEDARVRHADLNAGNILLAEHGPGWIIDLDRCRILSESAPAPTGPMRLRLERSVREVALRAGTPLSGAEWEALRAGFADRR